MSCSSFARLSLSARCFGPDGVRGHEGQVDLRLESRRELGLRLLRRLLQALEGHLVLREVDPLVLLELRHDPVDHPLVEVVAPEVGVAVGGLDLDDALADLEDGDVEGPSAEVVDRDRLVLLLVQAVGQRRRGGLVDDSEHLEAGDLTRVLRGLALRVVEVGGDRDDRLRHLLAEVLLGGVPHLLQDHRRDLRGRIQLALDRNAGVSVLGLDDLEGDHLLLFADLGVLATHEALDGEDGVLRVGDRLALGHLTHEPLALLAEGHDGGRGAGPLGVGDDGGVFALHDGHDGVGRPEVDADDLAHAMSPLACVGLLSSPYDLSVPLSSLVREPRHFIEPE